MTEKTLSAPIVASEAPLYLPKEWKPEAPRDVALDLLRGLAMCVLVVNHLHFRSPLEDVTSALVSAAEVLVLVSGVVAGMVFGRRWRTAGGRATTRLLLLRARKLYVASVAVVSLVGVLTLVPGAATEALTVTRGIDTYAFDGVADAVLSVLTLAAAPWQFNILGFFVVAIALTPALLWLLARGWSLQVAVGSVAVWAAARAWGLEALPSASERPFPLLVWQLLFVGGLLLGWHRERLERAVRRHARAVAAAVAAAALTAAWLVLAGPAADPEWSARHFDKDTLDPIRVLAMAALSAALYGLLRGSPARLHGLLLPLGRCSFYVFIVQVFVCLALASAPGLAGGAGPALGLAAQLAALTTLWWMASRGVLFRWIPR